MTAIGRRKVGRDGRLAQPFSPGGDVELAEGSVAGDGGVGIGPVRADELVGISWLSQR